MKLSRGPVAEADPAVESGADTAGAAQAAKPIGHHERPAGPSRQGRSALRQAPEAPGLPEKQEEPIEQEAQEPLDGSPSAPEPASPPSAPFERPTPGRLDTGRVPLGHYRERLSERGCVARLRNVRYSYDDGASWALDDVSLEVGAREWVCLMGANGSGKSTIARLLAGLTAPDGGEVELAGQACFTEGAPRGDAYREARRKTGIVFQNPQDQIVTTVVADDVAFGPENLGLAPEAIARRVDRELERVALSSLADADPTRLSGGQTQRVAIAGAMAMEPALMIFDEATAFLDVRGREALLRVARRLRSVCAQVWVTHSADEALLADRLIIVHNGRVVASGPPELLIAHTQELAGWGLEPPQVLQLSQRLHEGGIAVEPSLDEQRFALELARALERQSPRRPPSPRAFSQNTASRPTTAAVTPAREPGAALSTPPARTRGELPWQARKLGFSWGAAPTLRSIDLTVARGEHLCLVGATGSGKTTLMRLFAGLGRPTQGSLHALGLNLSKARQRRRLGGRIGFVMQHPERQLFAPTVAEDVAFGPKNRGLRGAKLEERVQQALKELGIEALAPRDPFSLSGGERRLAALAGILALAPEAWILDEPLAGLDVAARANVSRLLSAISAQGAASIVVTHAMEQAVFADRIVVLQEGAIRLAGTPEAVFSQADVLRACGLGLPWALSFAQLLASWDLSVGRPLTLDALARRLIRLAVS